MYPLRRRSRGRSRYDGHESCEQHRCHDCAGEPSTSSDGTIGVGVSRVTHVRGGRTRGGGGQAASTPLCRRTAPAPSALRKACGHVEVGCRTSAVRTRPCPGGLSAGRRLQDPAHLCHPMLRRRPCDETRGATVWMLSALTTLSVGTPETVVNANSDARSRRVLVIAATTAVPLPDTALPTVRVDPDLLSPRTRPHPAASTRRPIPGRDPATSARARSPASSGAAANRSPSSSDASQSRCWGSASRSVRLRAGRCLAPSWRRRPVPASRRRPRSCRRRAARRAHRRPTAPAGDRPCGGPGCSPRRSGR